MTDNKIYLDSIGIEISLQCRDNNYVLLDLSTASDLAIIVKRPDGDEVEWAATMDGTDHSILKYTTVNGDLDVEGEYLFQAKITTTTATFYSETQKFRVYPLFE